MKTFHMQQAQKVRLKGIAVSKGVGIGRAHLLDPIEIEFDDSPIDAHHVENEINALRVAQRTVRDELRDLKKTLPENAPEELSAFLDIHLLILQDPMLTDAVVERIEKQRANAKWALKQQLDEFIGQFDQIEDPYLRQRGDDIRQVGVRILRALSLVGLKPPTSVSLDEPIVIVARDIAPADMLKFKQEKLAGIVTELGGTTSHTALLAKSLGIPAILAVKDLLSYVVPDDLLVLDTDLSSVLIDPPQDLITEYKLRQLEYADAKTALLSLKDQPTLTQDNVYVELLSNIELPQDAHTVVSVGSDGVGLFRSEFLFLKKENNALYDEEQQYLAYRECVRLMNGKPVTIRTIDIGADKMPEQGGELDAHFAGGMPNPALALRAIRWSLADPEMFKVQLRAILRASSEGPVQIMLPMITFYREITKSQQYLEEAKAQLRQRGEPFDEHIPLGIMVEVPSCALSLESYLPLVDFVSVGTNDLVQYLLAVDRADASVSHLYSYYHPAFMRLLAHIIEICNKAKKPVSVCGEVAGDLQFVAVLLAMGLTKFSMHPAQILEVKKLLLQLNQGQLASQLPYVLASEDSIVAMERVQALGLT